jgi:ABC-2 type transport system permease protein
MTRFNPTRLRAMIVKEIWALLRDPKSRMVLILPPLVQLLIFTFATTLDVKNVDIGLIDRSGGAHAQELVQRIQGSPQFRDVIALPSLRAMEQAIDEQRVIAALIIESDFDQTIARGEIARVGLVLDGRRSNAAQILAGYVNGIALGYGAELRAGARSPTGIIPASTSNGSPCHRWSRSSSRLRASPSPRRRWRASGSSARSIS